DAHRPGARRRPRGLAQRGACRRHLRRPRDARPAVHRDGPGDRRDREPARARAAGDAGAGEGRGRVSKVTYTSASVDWEAVHREFDAALTAVRKELGRDYPMYIGGAPVVMSAQAPLVDVTPIDTSVVLGRFAAASPAHVDR